MNVSTAVRQYYLANFDQLPLDKQFHFAGRLAAWSNDPDCNNLLAELKPQILPGGDTLETLRQLIEQPPEAKINALGSRTRFFEKYPALRGRMLALFRVRHARDVYGVDLRADLLQVLSAADLRQLAEQLRTDDEALRVLSTYAINYLCLLTILFPGEYDDLLDLEQLYALGDGYNTDNPEDCQLLIYLYTHCIIGDSNFYARPVPTTHLPVYTRMLARLEALISERFGAINLDNKLEFLVCCRIIGYDTTLAEQIHAECDRSMSEEGTFVIDRENSFAQSNKKSFADSEHRNVLLIMSATEYQHAPATISQNNG